MNIQSIPARNLAAGDRINNDHVWCVAESPHAPGCIAIAAGPPHNIYIEVFRSAELVNVERPDIPAGDHDPTNGEHTAPMFPVAIHHIEVSAEDPDELVRLIAAVVGHCRDALIDVETIDESEPITLTVHDHDQSMLYGAEFIDDPGSEPHVALREIPYSQITAIHLP